MKDPRNLDELGEHLHASASPLGSWDAALHLRSEPFDAMVRHSWRRAVGGETARIRVTWRAATPSAPADAEVTQVLLELQPSATELAAGEEGVTMHLRVLGVEVRTGHGAPEGSSPGALLEPDALDCVTWGPTRSPKASSSSRLVAKSPIRGARDASAAGKAHWISALFVTLDDAELSLESVDLDGVDRADFQHQLGRWLARHLPKLEILRFDFDGFPNLVNLRPKSIRARRGGSENLLQIWMSSSVDPDDPPASDGVGPIPEGASFSLVVSSQIFFQKLLVPAYNRGSGEVKLAAVRPQTTGDKWSAKVRAPMRYQGTITCGGKAPPIHNHAELGFRIHGSASSGLALSSYQSLGGNIALDLEMEAKYPVVVSSDESGSNLRFDAGPWKVKAGPGVAERNVRPLLERFLGQDIKHDMESISLRPVSALLTENMSFSGSVPKISGSRAPGDFWTIGTFESTNGSP